MGESRLKQLHHRKQFLRQRSAVLREQLSFQSRGVIRPLVKANQRVQAGRRWVADHPAWLAGIAVLLFSRRTRGVKAWGKRAIWLWGLWRRVQPLLPGKTRT